MPIPRKVKTAIEFNEPSSAFDFEQLLENHSECWSHFNRAADDEINRWLQGGRAENLELVSKAVIGSR